MSILIISSFRCSTHFEFGSFNFTLIKRLVIIKTWRSFVTNFISRLKIVMTTVVLWSLTLDYVIILATTYTKTISTNFTRSSSLSVWLRWILVFNFTFLLFQIRFWLGQSIFSILLRLITNPTSLLCFQVLTFNFSIQVLFFISWWFILIFSEHSNKIEIQGLDV